MRTISKHFKLSDNAYNKIYSEITAYIQTNRGVNAIDLIELAESRYCDNDLKVAYYLIGFVTGLSNA